MIALSQAGSRAFSHSPVSRGRRSRSCQSPFAGVGSSPAWLPRELSCHSLSPSRAFPGAGLHLLTFQDTALVLIRGLSRRTNEDHQEKQPSLNFVSVVAILRSLNELQEVPSESLKIRGFCAALEDDNQLASSCHLPVGGASGDILLDINDRILSPSSDVLKKVSKLLSYLGVGSHRFYRFVGEESTKDRSLNCHVME